MIDAANIRKFALPDADLRLLQLLDADAARVFFARLQREIPWEQHRIRLFGREIDMPRLSCWIGDEHATYVYSRMRYEPRPWTPTLLELKESVGAVCGERFNSVLCNLYRSEKDSMGWHSDDEPELGARPVIASLSLGAVRRFRLRHKIDKRLCLAIDLPSGSLLVMAGATQKYYQHSLPKRAKTTAPRINLTFRSIQG